MAVIGKRLEPPEGVIPKVGDKVVYEVIYPDGQKGIITTFVDEFDIEFSKHPAKIKWDVSVF